MTILAKPICSLISGNFEYGNATGTYQSAPYILIILASMMITYSLGDIIYGQILLPMKKEKYYLIAIGAGTLLNIGLSILLGWFLPTHVDWLKPEMGVAIGTAFTDLLIIIFLISLTWKWVKHAIFNLNTLKLLVANLVIAGVTLALYNPLYTLWGAMKLNNAIAAIFEIGTIIVLDGIIYLLILRLTKETLVFSFSKKSKKQENVL